MGTQIDLKRNSGLPSLGMHTFKLIRFSEEEGTNGPYWRFICQVQDGPDQGKEVMLSLSHSQAARWKMDEFLDAVEAPEKGAASGERFVGSLFRATISHDTDRNGIIRAGLNSMIPYEGQLDMGTTFAPPSIFGGAESEDDDSDSPF